MNMNMFNNNFGNKLMNRFFRKVDNVTWDLMTGKMGLIVADGIATLDKDADGEYTVSINPMENFGVPIPAFAQNTAFADIKEGDVICSADKEIGWIIEKKENSFRVLRPNGNIGTVKPPKVQMLGLDSGTLILRDLLNILPGGSGGLDGMKNSMLPLMMSGMLDSDSMESMLPMLLMGGGNMGGNMLQTMMMMKLMGGANNKVAGTNKNFFDNIR